MIKKILILILAGLLLYTGCSDSGDDNTDEMLALEMSKEISGTIYNTDDVKVGTFSYDDYRFYYDYDGGGDEDVVFLEEDAGETGDFTPLNITTPDSSDNYTIDLPENHDDMGDLIAWVDTNGDGIFNLGTENGYFPKKKIDGIEYNVAIEVFTFGETYYLVSYYDGTSAQASSFAIVGNDGFNFYID